MTDISAIIKLAEGCDGRIADLLEMRKAHELRILNMAPADRPRGADYHLSHIKRIDEKIEELARAAAIAKGERDELG